jgi:hypothetical protein
VYPAMVNYLAVSGYSCFGFLCVVPEICQGVSYIGAKQQITKKLPELT